MTTLTDLLNNDAWDTRPCRPPIDTPKDIQLTADEFFPSDMYYRQARRLCAGCDIKNACLQFALDNDEEHGIWGGTTPKERATLKRQAGAA